MHSQKKQLTMDELQSLSVEELEQATGGGLVVQGGDYLVPRWLRLGVPVDRLFIKELGDIAQGGGL